MPFVLTALLILPAAMPVAATTTGTSATTAEAAAFTYANQERTSRGLTPLRLDSRIQAIAHGRAETMAAADELSHDQADGNNVFDILSANEVAWYGAGEIIAWNNTSSLTASAKGAVGQWIHSAPHRAILLSSNYNYVAFGVSVSPSSGKRYWAGVYIKGPDRSGAWTSLYTPTKQVLSSTRTKVTFRWTGSDTQLQVLTSGLRYYDVQRRVAGGEWTSYGATTATTLSTSWSRGYTYEFRVRAVDRVGNWGAWKTVSVTL
jgi:uncharacterized protein YkwD